MERWLAALLQTVHLSIGVHATSAGVKGHSQSGSLLQSRPVPIYSEGPWHLSDLGDALFAEARKPWQPKRGSEFLQTNSSKTDGVIVHWSYGFFGSVHPKVLHDNECDLPCSQIAYPGKQQEIDKADLLVSFPIKEEPPHNARGAPALAFTMEAGGLYGSENVWKYSGTANTSLDSTVPQPYFGLDNWHRVLLRAPGFPGFHERVPAAVFVARNCGSNQRNNFIAELVKRGVPVHSVSDCTPFGTKEPWPADVPRSDKLGVLRKYRVYLALENQVQIHYVTEKAMDGFAAGALPVYLGAPNADDYVPKGGYISATKAVSAPDNGQALDALAKTIKAAIEDESTWRGYMFWHSTPVHQLNGGALAKNWAWTEHTRDLCRMCRYAFAQLTPGASWDHKTQQVIGGTRPPKRGDVAAWTKWRQSVRKRTW